MKNLYIYESDIGKIRIAEEDNYITGITFENESGMNVELNETFLIKETFKQLQEYFKGLRKSFNIPIKLHGTEFQQKVWKALITIPYGETRSYKDIAKLAGNEKACRAVGMANNKNPISIIVPCHRVIGSDGKLVGYGGGLPIKDYLLRLERENI